MKLLHHLTFGWQGIVNNKPVDDDSSLASVRSTITAVPTNGKKARHGNLRRVHFNTSLNVTHKSEYSVDCDTLWSTPEEMKEYKDQTLWVAREIHRLESDDSRLLSYTKVMERTYATCCQTEEETYTSPMTNLEHNDLCKYMQGHASRIGLERLCVRDIARNKRARRAAIVDVVLEQQATIVPGLLRDQAMREASQAVSRASRLFARELAKAQSEVSYF